MLKEADILPINNVWKWDGTTQGKGSRYGMAKDWSQDAMWWYNADMWSAAGLKAPDPSEPITYDELADAAKRLTSTKAGKTSVYGLFTTTAGMNRIGSMVATAAWPDPVRGPGHRRLHLTGGDRRADLAGRRRQGQARLLPDQPQP